MVSFREYYEKESAWLPGKKGISLRREQWTALAGLIPSVDAKIAEAESSAGGGDASGSSESVTVGHLSETRRVTVGTFRGAVTVGVREYYRRDDDGPWLPGKKGIAFVEFADETQASLALQGLNNFKLTPTDILTLSFAKR